MLGLLYSENNNLVGIFLESPTENTVLENNGSLLGFQNDLFGIRLGIYLDDFLQSLMVNNGLVDMSSSLFDSMLYTTFLMSLLRE